MWTNIPKKSCMMKLINLMNIEGALHSPWFMTLELNIPKGVLKAVFHSSSGCIRIWKNASLRLIKDLYFAHAISLRILQGPTWTLRCWSPARLGKMCLCIIGSLWTGDHRFISRFPSCSYMETSSLGRKLLSSSESTPCELYCYIIIILNSF